MQEYDFYKFKELCYLWSSDFRTHITSKDGMIFKRLTVFATQFESKVKNKRECIENQSLVDENLRINLKRNNNLLIVSFKDVVITFNKLKGLAIKSFIKKGISFKSLFGTISHGTFSDINFSADFYSGNFNFQSPGKPQVTDLDIVEPEIYRKDYLLILKVDIKTFNGILRKEWIIDSAKEIITLRYKLK